MITPEENKVGGEIAAQLKPVRSLREVADMLAMSKSQVQNIERRALSKIAKALHKAAGELNKNYLCES